MERPIYLQYALQTDTKREPLPPYSADWAQKYSLPNAEKVLWRHCGIEVEVEEVPRKSIDALSHEWIIDRDLSLRGDNAYEFKTPHPCRVIDGLSYVQSFCTEVLKAREVSRKAFCFSERTSIHVHIDVRDLRLSQIRAALKLYLIFEKSYFDLVGRDRYHNIFWIPLMETQQVNNPPMVNDRMYQTWDKYCAANPQTVKSFGTLEFRAMAGNCDEKLISSWILMLSCLVEYCKQHTLEQVEETISVLKWESQYMQLLTEILGDNLAQLLTIFPEVADNAASLTKNL